MMRLTISPMRGEFAPINISGNSYSSSSISGNSMIVDVRWNAYHVNVVVRKIFLDSR